MAEVPEDAKRFLERATYLRGSIVGSFAQVEYYLGDLGHQAARLTEYAEFARFHRSFSARLQTAKDIAAAPGPLSRFRSGIEGVCMTLSTVEPYRNYFTHGWLEIRMARPPVLPKYHLQFRKWNPAKPHRPVYLRVSMDWLEELDGRAMAMAVVAGGLFRQIYLDLDWPDPLFETAAGDLIKNPTF